MKFKLTVKRSDLDRALEAEKNMEIIRITLGGNEFYAKTKFSTNIEICIWSVDWGYSEDVIKDGFYYICYNDVDWIQEFNRMQNAVPYWGLHNLIYKIDETN